VFEVHAHLLVDYFVHVPEQLSFSVLLFLHCDKFSEVHAQVEPLQHHDCGNVEEDVAQEHLVDVHAGLCM